MRSLLRVRGSNKKKVKDNVKIPSRSNLAKMELEGKVEFIRSLIPLGLMQVSEMLEAELIQITGEKYDRKGGTPGHVRYGTNPGSVYLGVTKYPLRVPRVRNLETNEEVSLESYHQFHTQPTSVNEILLRRVLYGISCKNYEPASESIPGAFGLSSSTVSRRFIKSSSIKLREFQERDLSCYEIVALFIDGKSFAEDEMVLAMGITSGGDKIMLGYTQTSTENERSVSELLKDLLSRGLQIDHGVLCVIDGSKGLHAAIRKVFKDKCLIQRCQWHKRENVVSYLPKSEQASMRKRLQRAYSKPTYDEAKLALNRIRKELYLSNQSGLNSLDEGFEETLTLHRLGLFPLIGESFKTTNCIESINSIIEKRCGKVGYWKTSNQKQRWLATALLDIEPRLQRVRGYRHLNRLQTTIMKKLGIQRHLQNENFKVPVVEKT